jgi:hypothetical protein
MATAERLRIARSRRLRGRWCARICSICCSETDTFDTAARKTLIKPTPTPADKSVNSACGKGARESAGYRIPALRGMVWLARTRSTRSSPGQGNKLDAGRAAKGRERRYHGGGRNDGETRGSPRLARTGSFLATFGDSSPHAHPLRTREGPAVETEATAMADSKGRAPPHTAGPIPADRSPDLRSGRADILLRFRLRPERSEERGDRT